MIKYEIEDQPGERWVDIKGYEGLYQISDVGRVKSLGRYIKNRNGESYIKPLIKKSSYLGDRRGGTRYQTALRKDGYSKNFLINRLVASHFMGGITDKDEVIHLDGDVRNNIPTNLKIVSDKEKRNLEIEKGQHCKKVIQKSLDGEFIKTWNTTQEAEKYYSYGAKTFTNINRCLKSSKRKQAYGYKREYLLDK